MFTNNFRCPDDYLAAMICPKCGEILFRANSAPDRCPKCGAPIEISALTRLKELIEKYIFY